MSTFSYWEFSKFNSLSEVVELLKQNTNSEIKIDNDLWTYKNPVIQFNNIDDYGVDLIKNVTISNKIIKFVYFEGFTERTTNKNSWIGENGRIKAREDLITKYKCDILLFEYNSTVHGVLFRARSTAERIIGYLFKNDIWGEITAKNLGITEDLFYWIFQRVKDYSDEPLAEKSGIFITGLQSYVGKTKDNINAVRGEGHRIAAVLGTIAFLFNNESLKAVRPEIEYKKNKILIEMSLVGTCKIWENKYVIGELVDSDEILQRIKMVIYVSLELIPKLLECYKINCAKKQWSPQMKLNFLKTLGNEINDKVNIELVRIKEQISKELADENEEYENDEDEQDLEDLIDVIDEDELEE